MGIGIGILVLAGIVIAGIAIVRQVLGKREGTPGGGGDVLAYLLLALAVGVAGFALASLAATAFPSGDFVIDVRGRVANSLAALVVATPVAVFLWRRQERRRTSYPTTAGWTVYLALIEAVFMTSLVVALFGFFEWLFADGGGSGWTNLVVFGGIVTFHEWAMRRTPPTSDGASLPRIVGSAIGFVATVIGLGGILSWLLTEVYSTLAATAGGSEFGTWLSFLLAGAPVWYYRWLRPWKGEADTPRNAWTFLVSVVGLTAALGSLTTIVIQTLAYLLSDTEPAGTHFEFLPPALAVTIVAAASWAHHRHRLGRERTDAVRAYVYAMSAVGLATTVGAATGLSTAAFGPASLIGRRTDAIIALAITLITGAAVWWYFWLGASREPREIEAPSGPRRFYLIGMSVVMGLTSAGALIAALIIVFQRLLETGSGDSVVVPISLFIFAGLATWHLLRVNAEDRDLIGSEESITPFSVTIVCSHPGMVSARFPDVAKVRVLYRGDDAGVVSDEMADEIVAAVANRSSYVWVDSDGFRVAVAR